MHSILQGLINSVQKRFPGPTGLDWTQVPGTLQAKEGWPTSLTPGAIVRDHQSGFLGVFQVYEASRKGDLKQAVYDDLYALSLAASDAAAVARRGINSPWSVHLFAIVTAKNALPKHWDHEFSEAVTQLLEQTNVLSAVGLTRLSGNESELLGWLPSYASGDWVQPVCDFLAPLLLELRSFGPVAPDAMIQQKTQHLAEDLERMWPTPPATPAGEIRKRVQEGMTAAMHKQLQPLLSPPAASGFVPELASLTMKGFRRFVDVTLQFSPLTVLSGANGSGKTTVFDAVELALTGKLARLERNQSASTDLYCDTLSHGGAGTPPWGELVLSDSDKLPLTPSGGPRVAQEDFRTFALAQEDLHTFVRCTPEQREVWLLAIWGLRVGVEQVRKFLDPSSGPGTELRFPGPDSPPQHSGDPDSGYVQRYVAGMEFVFAESRWVKSAETALRCFGECRDRVGAGSGVSQAWKNWLERSLVFGKVVNELLAALHSGATLPGQDLLKAWSALQEHTQKVLDLYRHDEVKAVCDAFDRSASPNAPPLGLLNHFQTLMAGPLTFDAEDTARLFDATSALQDPDSAEWQVLRSFADKLLAFMDAQHDTSVDALVHDLVNYYDRIYPALLERNWRASATEKFERFVREVLSNLTKGAAGRVFRELTAALTSFNWTHLALEADGASLTAKKPSDGTPFGDVGAMLNQAEQQIAGLAWFLTTYLVKGHKNCGVVLLDDPFQGLDDTNLQTLLRLFNDILKHLNPVAPRTPPQVVLCLHQGAVVELLKQEFGFRDFGSKGVPGGMKASEWPRIHFYEVIRVDGASSTVARRPNHMYRRVEAARWGEVFENK